ncbi:MAG: hypothetical protein M3512_07680 [Bacteroidota bacterium]|nr:hypothetical protein [Bacteroidota bacterium]
MFFSIEAFSRYRVTDPAIHKKSKVSLRKTFDNGGISYAPEDYNLYAMII